MDRNILIKEFYDDCFGNPNFLSMWEGGSKAFKRDDEFSDLDILFLIKDNYRQEAHEIIEKSIIKNFSIKDMFLVPQPSWHGHFQVFYKLDTENQFFMLDILIAEESKNNLFDEPQIHGEAFIYFDKTHRIGKSAPDIEKMVKSIDNRVYLIEKNVNFFHNFVDKEILRGRSIDALSFYHSVILNPLIETYRIIFYPYRYNFAKRYLQYDLPKKVYEKIEKLSFINDIKQLKAYKIEAMEMLMENIKHIKEKKYHFYDIINPR